MPREVLELNLERQTESQPWGFRVIGGTDEALILKVDKIHGIGTPAGRAQLEANDAIIFANEQDVTDMKHHEVVQFMRKQGLKMQLIVERGDHVIPSISEAFPNPEVELKSMTKEEKLAYYQFAMKKGLERFLIPDNFTTVGKPKVKVPKYNCPRGLYSDETMDDMITGSTVDAAKLDPEGPAMQKLKKAKRFDPAKSGVMDVLDSHAKGDFSVDRKAIIEAQRMPIYEEVDQPPSSRSS